MYVTVDQKEAFVGSGLQMFVVSDKGMCLMEALSSVSCTSVRVGAMKMQLIFFIKPTNVRTVYTFVWFINNPTCFNAIAPFSGS